MVPAPAPPCFCGAPRVGLVAQREVDGVTVPAHVCRQCAEHCQIEAHARGSATAAERASATAPPGMVWIGDGIAVDPNDVRVVAGTGAGCRVYLKDHEPGGVLPGRGFYLEVSTALPEVVKRLGRTA